MLQSRQNTDMKDVQAQLQESEATRQLLQAEVCHKYQFFSHQHVTFETLTDVQDNPFRK